ncbi:MAG TPA: hypothetical protein VF649_10325 [Sphingomonas sp.]|jgi:hypothetical protein|uniref:hypothetical protein n=1 Tax=Sphingomonas sp. TaxID=28214 RepID=UPI002ED9F2C4
MRQRIVQGMLRVGGLLLIVVGAALLRLLPTLTPGWIAIGLAALAFFGVSSGSALLVLGPHVTDPVELGERWTTRRSDRTD